MFLFSLPGYISAASWLLLANFGVFWGFDTPKTRPDNEQKAWVETHAFEFVEP
jgi:hypothetical protein